MFVTIMLISVFSWVFCTSDPSQESLIKRMANLDPRKIGYFAPTGLLSPYAVLVHQAIIFLRHSSCINLTTWSMMQNSQQKAAQGNLSSNSLHKYEFLSTPSHKWACQAISYTGAKHKRCHDTKKCTLLAPPRFEIWLKHMEYNKHEIKP